VKVSDTSYEEAKRVYDRILREKTSKGYQIAQATANGNEAIAVGLPVTKEHSGHTPEIADAHRGAGSVAIGAGCLMVVPAEI